jgi:hypothetical protein
LTQGTLPENFAMTFSSRVSTAVSARSFVPSASVCDGLCDAR